jgi:hypothetical protein
VIRGSCLCGAVAFEIDGRVTPIQLCHARRCQKFTGSAFSPELACREERFRWVRGADNVTSYEAPLLREPPPLRRAFCRTCGSPVPVHQPETGSMLLLAGVLDDDPGTRPFGHIFTSHGPAWWETTDALPKHPERPPPEQRLRRRER